MACKLLIKNISNNYSTGDVILVVDGVHDFGKFESKTNFLDSGGVEIDWPSHFVIVNITDSTKEDLDYLSENNESGRRYYITRQFPASPYHQDLSDYAEVTLTTAELTPLINDRGA